MDEDDLTPLRQPAKQRDLAPMAIAELGDIGFELEGEILRAREAIAAKRKQRGGAEGLFKR